MLLKKSLLLLSVKLVTVLLSFTFHLLLAREIPQADYGLFNLMLTCLMFTVVISKRGLESAIVRHFAQATSNEAAIMYKYVLRHAVINTLVVSVVLFVFDSFWVESIFGTTKLLEFVPFIILITQVAKPIINTGIFRILF